MRTLIIKARVPDFIRFQGAFMINFQEKTEDNVNFAIDEVISIKEEYFRQGFFQSAQYFQITPFYFTNIQAL